MALEAYKLLEEEGISARIVNMATIKPIDADTIIESAKKTGCIVTCEEHNIIGGLGSAVCEVLAENAPVPVLRIGVNDVFGESGPAKTLIAKYGLDAESIYNKVKAYLA
jgi:transketolase